MKFIVAFQDGQGTTAGICETEDFEKAREALKGSPGDVFIRVADIEEFSHLEDSGYYYVLEDLETGGRCYGIEWAETQDHKVGDEFLYGYHRVKKLMSTNDFRKAQDAGNSLAT